MFIFKKILKIVLSILLVLLVVVGGYFAYVFISYHRIGDMELEPTKLTADPISVSQEYTILSYNIGFGRTATARIS